LEERIPHTTGSPRRGNKLGIKPVSEALLASTKKIQNSLLNFPVGKQKKVSEKFF